MSAKIRGRLTELAGDVIEWFAWKDPYSGENRPRAVILGTRAFCIAEPRIDSTGRAVYELSRYEFAPGSHKSNSDSAPTGPRERNYAESRGPAGCVFAEAQE